MRAHEVGREALVELTASEICARLHAGSLRSREVVEAFLARIEQENPRVRAVPVVCADAALAEADEADRVHASGRTLGPLHGLPMTIKDAFRVHGVRSTYGMTPYRHYVPGADSEVIRRLRAAGAIVLGRSSVPFASFDWNCRNWNFPETVNPHDHARVPGGSSGGAAAALASCMTPIEIGTDIAGSIRYPAHCCGVFGLRTTDGLLPIDDLGPENLPRAFERLVTVGPLARNVPDLRLVLSALGVESDSAPLRSRLRIAWIDRAASVVADETTRGLLAAWLNRLSRRHEVFEARPEVDDEVAYRVWGHIVGYEYRRAIPGGVLGRAFTSLYTLRYRLGVGPLTQYVREGLELSETGYQEALRVRESKQRRVDQFFVDHADVWVLPVSPGVAIERMNRGRDIQTKGGPVSYSRYLGAFLCPTAVYGTPALTIPIGVGERGLPVAVQVHSARFSDMRLLNTAVAHLS